MAGFKNIIDKINANEDVNEIKTSTWKQIVNGEILTKKFIRRQYLLILLLVVLSIWYIDNRYSSEKQIARVTELRKKIQDAKYESLTVSAELVEISKRSSIILLMQSKGMELRGGNTPPISIE
jgi:cell division protein FtsL